MCSVPYQTLEAPGSLDRLLSQTAVPDDLEVNSEQYNGSGRLETFVSPSPNQEIFKSNGSYN